MYDRNATTQIIKITAVRSAHLCNQIDISIVKVAIRQHREGRDTNRERDNVLIPRDTWKRTIEKTHDSIKTKTQYVRTSQQNNAQE